MRGQVKKWGIPTTLTIVYKPYLNQWFASFTVNVEVIEPLFGSNSELNYESLLAIDLGTETALTGFDGSEFIEIQNPRFIKSSEQEVKNLSKKLRRKRSPNYQKKISASKRWKKKGLGMGKKLFTTNY